jgi:hypothetical protein
MSLLLTRYGRSTLISPPLAKARLARGESGEMEGSTHGLVRLQSFPDGLCIDLRPRRFVSRKG